jgi:hypothetical protein
LAWLNNENFDNSLEQLSHCFFILANKGSRYYLNVCKIKILVILQLEIANYDSPYTTVTFSLEVLAVKAAVSKRLLGVTALGTKV